MQTEMGGVLKLLSSAFVIGSMLGTWAAWQAALPTAAPVPIAALIPILPSATLAQQSMDAELLAAVALSEDPDAAVAVMHVVLNRARTCNKTVLEIVATPEQFHGWGRGLDPRRGWQDGWSRGRLQSLEGLAWRVMRGEVPDPTRGATHFHAIGSWEPPWAEGRQMVALGRTYFYGS